MNQVGLPEPLFAIAFSMLTSGVSPTPALRSTTGVRPSGSRWKVPRGDLARSVVPGSTLSWK